MVTMSPAQIQKYLGGVDYPATKQDLLKHAQQEGADEAVLSMLQQLPEQTYQRPADVSEALGKII